MNKKYNSRLQKIYDDYNDYSTEELFEYVNNSSKYRTEVIQVINDILAERNEIEDKGNGTGLDVPLLEAQKERHGCVTAYLIFMIVVNSIVSLIYFVSFFIGRFDSPIIIIAAIMGLLNVYFATQLMQWKKAGYYGFFLTVAVSFVLSFSIGGGTPTAIGGLIGIGVLYAVLQIKKDGVSAWENME